MGNDALHELTAPKRAEVELAIGVIEDLLNFFYELDYKASRLREMRRIKKAKPTRTEGAAPASVTTALLEDAKSSEEVSPAEFAKDGETSKPVV